MSSERYVGILDLVHPTSVVAKLKDWSRGWPLLAIFLLALAAVAIFSPAKVLLGIWGIAKLALGGYAGFWTSRWAAPYARPHLFLREGLPPDQIHAVAFAISLAFRGVLMATGVIAAGFIP